MATFAFDIGSQVFCKEGPCGRLRKVVVDPHTRRVTDLVMAKGGMLGEDRVLPVSLVERATRQHIYLSNSQDDLASYPEYREVEFRRPAPEVEPYGADQVACYWSGYDQICAKPVVPMVRQRVHEGISPEEEPIERGTEVRYLATLRTSSWGTRWRLSGAKVASP
jgi:hypothetical protein